MIHAVDQRAKGFQSNIFNNIIFVSGAFVLDQPFQYILLLS